MWDQGWLGMRSESWRLRELMAKGACFVKIHIASEWSWGSRRSAAIRECAVPVQVVRTILKIISRSSGENFGTLVVDLRATDRRCEVGKIIFVVLVLGGGIDGESRM